MESIINLYRPALISVTVLILILLLQNILSAIYKITKDGQRPGVQADGNNSDLPFRMYRTHMNSVENFSSFAVCVLIAVLVGTNPKLVNILAVAHVLVRIGFWAIYVSGLGKLVGGPRTLSFALGWGINLILALATFFSLVI